MFFRFLKNRCFCLFEKESLKGLTVLVVSLAGCLHTSRIITNGVNTLIRVSFSERCFFLFFLKPQSHFFAGGPIFPFHVLQYTFHDLQCTSHGLQYTFHDLQLNFGVKVKIKIRPSKYFQMEFSNYSHSSIAFVELFCCNYISGKTPKTRLNALIFRRMRVKQ